MLVPTMFGKRNKPAHEESEGWQEALRRIEEARQSNARDLDLSNLRVTTNGDVSLRCYQPAANVQRTENNGLISCRCCICSSI
jgi:hypothetical protein